MTETSGPALPPLWTPEDEACARLGRSVLWGGFLVGLTLVALRIAALGDDWAFVRPGSWGGVLLRGMWQDWLLVLSLTLVTLALMRTANGLRGKRFWAWVFITLSSLILLWGLANLLALKMLGGPVTRDWLIYSDIAHTDVILDSIFFLVPLQEIATVFVGLCIFWLLVARLSRRGARLATFGIWVFGFGTIGGLALSSAPAGVAQARLANPIFAFVGSLAGTSGAEELAGLAGQQYFGPSPFPIVPGLPRPNQSTPIRNVIVYALESTPYNQTQGFGGTWDVNPNLAARLQHAIAFDRAYAHVPASNYFLVSMVDGIVPELSSETMTTSRDQYDLTSLADVLAQAGLRTGFFNSSDNRFQNTGPYMEVTGYQTVRDYRDWNCETGVYEYENISQQFLNTSSELCTADQIIGWIDAAPDTPFLVTFRTGMTHYPYFPGENPQTYVDDEIYNNYLNAVRTGDEALGKILDYLDAAGLADSTLVVVLGDHGESFGTHGTYGHGSGLHEENVHIPLALINPVLFDGTRSDLFVGIADMAPTITDLMGLAPAQGWEGRSVFAEERPAGVFFFAPWNGFQAGFREGDRKYIYNGNSGESWLYDLSKDPLELTNLVDNVDAVADARADLGAIIAAHNGFIDRLLGRSTASLPTLTKRPTAIEIIASGTKYQNPPQGWVILDGEDVGGFEVSSAPSNALRAATPSEIGAAMTTFRLPVSPGKCPNALDIYFINDEWAGDGQTGDTDLIIRSVRFGDVTYFANRIHTLEPGIGGNDGENFRFWRNGMARISLELSGDCLDAAFAN